MAQTGQPATAGKTRPVIVAIGSLIKQSVMGYIDDNCLSRGAAIAYYTVTSLAPVLIIVVAIAGLVFGPEAARGAIVGKLSGVMGHDGAELIQTMIRSASNRASGLIASVIGIMTLLVTASGVFTEMQSSLNAIWRTSATGSTVKNLVVSRLQSLLLVGSLGFLLAMSLLIAAGLTALGHVIAPVFPWTAILLHVLNFAVSLLLITLLFAAIYKVLPDTHLTYRDVMVGALVTAFLFDVGKFLIGLYLGSSSVASSYGAAGALAVILVWIYYSAQIFLLGAEFTRAYAHGHGSRARSARNADVAPTGPTGQLRQRLDGHIARSGTVPASDYSVWGLLAGVFLISAIWAERRR